MSTSQKYSQLVKKQYEEKKHTQKKKKLKFTYALTLTYTLPVLGAALFLQIRWRSVIYFFSLQWNIFPEFLSLLQFLRAGRVVKRKKKKKKTSGYRIPLIQTASQTQRQLSPTSLTSQLQVKTNGNNPAAGSN